MIIWDDPVGEGVNVSTKIKLQVWNQGMNLVNELSQQGYQTVFSQPFYLDNLKNDWGTIYEVQDLDDKLPGLLGAEAWSEFSLSTLSHATFPCCCGCYCCHTSACGCGQCDYCCSGAATCLLLHTLLHKMLEYYY